MKTVYAQEADPVRGICGAHGGHETAEVRGVRRTDRGRGLRGRGGRKWTTVDGVSLLDDLTAFGISAD